jgi:hypothetical protein
MPNVELEQSLKGKLADLDNERALVKQQLDRERLTVITSSLIDTITSPRFIERMRQFREKAAAGARLGDAADLMSLESLRAAGAQIPDDFRLTSRIFEDSETGLRFEIKPPRAQPDFGNSVAWGACAGGGAATVCGCAGGST